MHHFLGIGGSIIITKNGDNMEQMVRCTPQRVTWLFAAKYFRINTITTGKPGGIELGVYFGRNA